MAIYIILLTSAEPSGASLVFCIAVGLFATYLLAAVALFYFSERTNIARL